MLRTFNNDPYVAGAAYNAGPGAVKAAIEKGLKTGQDPLNFLPQETRDYVQFLRTGVQPKGGAPGNVPSLNDNRPTADPALPPDVARALAMTNPVSDNISGRPNRSFMDWLTSERTIVPLLAGIGGMLSSRSPQLLPAVGEGLVAGAGAYGSLARDTRRQDITQQQVDANTMSQLQGVWATLRTQAGLEMRANNGIVSPDTAAALKRVQDQILALGGRLPGAQPVTPTAGGNEPPPALRSAPTPSSGAGSAPAAPSVTPRGVVSAPTNPNAPTAVTWSLTESGKQVHPDTDPDRLLELANRTTDPAQAERWRAEANAIRQSGRVRNVDGQEEYAKGFPQYQREQQSLTTNRKWVEENSALENQRKMALQGLDILREVLEGYQTNPAATVTGNAQAWFKAAGLNAPSTAMTNAAAVQEIQKQIAKLAADQGGTDVGRALVQLSGIEATKDPAANRKILAQAYGDIRAAEAKARTVMDALKNAPHADIQQLMTQWERENPRENFYKEAFNNNPVLGDVELIDIPGMGARPDVSKMVDGALYILTPEQIKRLTGREVQRPMRMRFSNNKLEEVR